MTKFRSRLQKAVDDPSWDDSNAPPGARFSTLVEPTQAEAEAVGNLIAESFEDNVEEVRAALDGKSYYKKDESSYSYATSFIPVIKLAGKIQAAAIVVEKNIAQRIRIFEIVWFCTTKESKGSGVGSYLFHMIHQLAKVTTVGAILCESTNRALSFWLTRKNIEISSELLRSVERCELKDVEFHPEPEQHAIYQKIVLSRHEKDFFVRNRPCKSMEMLYTDRVYRSRKGRVTTSSPQFEGTPYRYNVQQSNHLWYIVDPHLKRVIGKKTFVNK